jgi:branched-chain amino acid aminotransferase
MITPKLTGSILPGITRDSVIHIAKEKLGLDVEERRISIDEAMAAEEVFCAGTAAIISPIGSIKYNNKEHLFSNGDVGPITRELYDILTGIQYGNDKDPFDWIIEL